MYAFQQEANSVNKTCPIWDRNFKIDLFWLVRVQKGPKLISFHLKINSLIPIIYIPQYIPQPHFWEKKNPNFLIFKELGFLNVVPPGPEPTC